MSGSLQSAIEMNEPWLGLASYSREDHALFFGRRREADELARMIRREVLCVLFGPSGTGKTSLVNAGVFPTLQKEPYLPVYVRLDHTPGSAPPGLQVRKALEQEVGRAALDLESLAEEGHAGAAAPEPESLWEYLHRVELWNARNEPVTPVLFIDQFEEAFTLGAGRAETADWLGELADLVENYIPASVRDRLERDGRGLPYPQVQRYKFVLSLREDFVHRLDDLRRQMPSIMHNRYRLARMDGEQALEAVCGPGGAFVTREVAEQIVRTQQPERTPDRTASTLRSLEVEPALLSVVCRELNARRKARRMPQITSELVRESSADGDVLTDFYERCFEKIPGAARTFVEDRLLTGSGFRSTAPEEDATKAGISEDVLRTLEDGRLIRRESRLGIPHIELTHDLLTKVVRRSRDERIARDRLERERQAHLERERKLEDERATQAARLRMARRRTVTMGAIAAVCLVLAASAGFFYYQARAASSRLYEERAAAAVQKGDLVKAWLYTLEALHTSAGSPMPVSFARLLQPELRPGSRRARVTYAAEADVSSVAMHPDGTFIAAATGDDHLDLWSTGATRELTSNVPTLGKAWHVAFSPDGRRLAAVVRRPNADEIPTADEIQVWELDPLRQVCSAKKSATSKFTTVMFSPNGLLAAGDDDGGIHFWNPDCAFAFSLIMCRQDNEPRPISSMAFRSESTELAATQGSFVHRWDWKSQKQLAEKVALRGVVRTVAWSRQGNRLAAGDDSGRLCWDLQQEKAPPCHDGHESAVLSLAFGGDARTVVSGSADGSVRVWDLEARPDPRMLARLDGSAPVTGIAWDRQDRWLAYASGAVVRRLEFTARPFDQETSIRLLDLLRTPASQQTITDWRNQSFKTLGYQMVNTELEASRETAEAARGYFTGVPQFSEHTTLRFDNKALRDSETSPRPLWKAGELLLVPDRKGVSSAIFLKSDVPPPFDVEFEYSIKNRLGRQVWDWRARPADGIVFMFLKDRSPYVRGTSASCDESRGQTEADFPPAGSDRAFAACSGYGVHFEVFEGTKVSLTKGRMEILRVPRGLAQQIPDTYTDGTWRKVRVNVTSRAVTVSYENVPILRFDGHLDTTFNGIGFGAATGDASAEHKIRNVKITVPDVPS